MNAASGANLAASSGNYVNSGNYQKPESYSSTVSQKSTVAAVTADSLSGQSLQELQTGRNGVLAQLGEAQRLKKENVGELQANLDTAKAAYDEAAQKLELDDEITDQQGRSLKQLKEEKVTVDGQISDQKGVVDGFNDSIASQNDVITDLNNKHSQLEGEEPNIDQFQLSDGEYDDAAFNEAHAKWEAELRDLEAEIEEAEETLTKLQLDLADAEAALTQLEQQGAQIDQSIEQLATKIPQNDPNMQAFTEAKKAFDDAQKAYDDAQNNNQYDANIAQLQDNLNSYDTAITQAQTAEQAAQKQEKGLSTDERIKSDTDDNGNEYNYVEVEAWGSNGNKGNDCLSRIINNSYDFEALGIKPYSAEYQKLMNAVIEANPNIYSNGRAKIFDGSVANTVIHSGDKMILPNAYEVLGLDKPSDKPAGSTETTSPSTSGSTETTSPSTSGSTETTSPSTSGSTETTSPSVAAQEGERPAYVPEDFELDERGNYIKTETKNGNTITTTIDSSGKKSVTEVDSNGRIVLSESYGLTDEGNFRISARVKSEFDGNSYLYSKQEYEYYDDDGALTKRATFVRNSEGQVFRKVYEPGKGTTYERAIGSDQHQRWEECTQEQFENRSLDGSRTYTSDIPEFRNITSAKGSEYLKQIEALEKDIQQFEDAGLTYDAYETASQRTDIFKNVLNDSNLSASDKISILRGYSKIDRDMVVNYLASYDGPSSVNKILYKASYNDAIALNKAFGEIYGQGSVNNTVSGYMEARFGKNSNATEATQYIARLIDILDNSNSYQNKELSKAYDIPTTIQYLLKGDNESLALKLILQKVGPEVTNQSRANIMKQYDYSETVLAGIERNYNSVQKILEAKENNKIDKNMAIYLLSNVSGSSIEKLVEQFRDMGSGKQEKYISTLLELLY